MTRFCIRHTAIEGLKLLQRHPMGDSRGYLERLFCADELSMIMGNRTIVQINHTLTAKSGAVRGMHFQYAPHTEMKLVTCLRGEVFDVAVDLRQRSSTLLQWHSELLSGDNHKTLVIPEGFAHGFQSLTDECEMLYLHTAAFQSDSQSGIDALDPRLNIDWPLTITERSLRDQAFQPLRNDFSGIGV